jgi:putative two-component system response regulator
VIATPKHISVPNKSGRDRYGSLGKLPNGEQKVVHSEIAEPACRTVLVVDSPESNLDHVRGLLEDDGFRVLTTLSGADALDMLETGPVDLVVLDSRLSDMDGVEFCRRLRGNSRTEPIPVFMLSRLHEVEHEISAIGAGADEFLARPFHPQVFVARVRSMRHSSVADPLEETETILQALAQAVELRDPHTAGHCDRIAALSVALGMTMGLPSPHLLALHRGGYLHDIGKIVIPDSVLFKNGPLNEAEWVIMRAHTIKGEAICRPIKCLGPVLPVIRSHHERFDGSGYPDGLAGQDIPLLARVLQLADIYDALTAVRCYKAAMKSADALCLMQEETDRGWHDPELMRIFMRLRHDAVREASECYAVSWQDLQVMQSSLENLRASILRS